MEEKSNDSDCSSVATGLCPATRPTCTGKQPFGVAELPIHSETLDPTNHCSEQTEELDWNVP